MPALRGSLVIPAKGASSAGAPTSPGSDLSSSASSTAPIAANSIDWVMPEEPLDVLAQQIAAETSAREWSEGGACLHWCAPYRALQCSIFL